MTDNERLKALERALHDCEAGRARTQALTHLGNWKLDVGTRTGCGSDEFFRILGIPPPKVFAYRDFEALVHPDDRSRVTAGVTTIITERKTVEMEYRIVRPDGTVRHVKGEGEFAVESGKEILFGTIQDVTGRVHLEQALRESEKSFIDTFEASPAPTVICRQEDEHYVAVNRAFERASGISRPEALGKTTDELHLTPVPGVMPRLLKELKQGGDVYNREIIFQGRGKNSIVGLASIIPFVFHHQPCFLFVGVDISDRKKAEDALKESETKYRETIEHALAGIYEVDFRNERFTSVNEGMSILTGYSRKELLSLNPFDLLDDEGKATFRKRIQSWLAGKKPAMNVEYRLRTKDGRIKNVVLNATFKTDEQGKPWGATVVGHDITQRKQAEEALRESEKSFASIFKASPAPIVVIRRSDGTYLEVNKAFEAASGYSRSEVIGKPPGEFSVFPDRRSRDKLLGEVARKGGVFNREMILEGKGGKKINGLVSILPITFRAQNCFLFVGIDITGMKRAREQLEQNQAILDTFIANAPGIIVILDEQFRHIKVNKAAAEVIGKDPREIEGKPVEAVMPPEIAQNFIADYRKILEAGSAATGREVTMRFPGRREPVQVLTHRFRIPLPQGKWGIGVFGIDITARKQAEDALRRNEYELKTIIDNTPDIYFRLNRQHQYVFVNPTYEKLTGLPKEQFVGKTNSQLGMTQQMVRFWQSTVQEVFESGKEHTVEFEMSGLFGDRYFSARLFPEFEKSGLVGTVLVIARDITNTKHVEEEIAALKK